ncbi:MAG: ROK family protein [Planctomycetaceae bacterium]
MSDNGKHESSERNLWLGFDLGGTKMMACVCDSDFRILGRKRKATKGYEGSEAGVDRVKSVIRRALEEAEVGPERIAGIGIGIPGPVDTVAGVVLETPNLGWTDLPLREILEAEYGCPTVVLNDVDAGVYGEYRLGAARDARCVIGLSPGTGIGGGCVYHGDILTGDRISCFEVGHMRVQPDGPLCGCGQHGCLEAVASRLAISSAAARAAYQGNAPHLKQISGTDLSQIRSGALADSIREGDVPVEQVVREGTRKLGMAAGWLVNLIGPDVILLGGGLVEALPGIYADEVQRAAESQAMPSFRGTFRVCVANLGDFAAVKGAAAWAHRVVDRGTEPVA